MNHFSCGARPVRSESDSSRTTLKVIKMIQDKNQIKKDEKNESSYLLEGKWVIPAEYHIIIARGNSPESCTSYEMFHHDCCIKF